MTPRRGRGGDDGFALPFVLLVITMVSIAVAATFAVTTPNIASARADANGQRASAAARAGVDDAEAWLEGDAVCRSTTRICDKAFGADSASLTRTALTAVGAAVRWRIDPTATVDGYLRVRSTATVDRSTRSVVADLALAPSILSYGYYSDYESSSPDVLVDQFPARSIRVDNGTWSTTTSAPKTLTWNGLSAANVALCGLHWWDDNGVTGRGRNAQTARSNGQILSPYTESGSGNGSTVSRSGNCNVVFTAGNVFDGPIYTRDAMLISQDTTGAGPTFNQPVTTGWGFGTHNLPAAPALTPWLRNQSTTCCDLSSSPQQPQTARFDLQLPLNIGTEGLAPNACVYSGPTRVVLNGNGTATVTSPRTTSAATGADSRCYPASLSGGVVEFVVAYASGVGGGTIIARNAGTEPAAGWPETGVRSTDAAPTQAGSAMWVSTSGGSANAPTSAASDTCPSATYAATAGAACAWSELPDYRATTPTDGWKAYSSTASCTNYNTPTDQRQFECDLLAAPSGASVGSYAAFRSAVKARLAATACTGTVAAQQTCVTAALKAVLPPATTKAAYVPVPTAASGPTDGAAVDGGVPAAPQAGDALFTAGPTTASKQTPTSTTLSYRVDRQSLTNGAVTATTPQFSLTVTGVAWRTTSPGSATAYFPDVRDVTPYGRADASGNAPGDLYVEGTNTGKVSLLGDQDVVVTGDVVDAGSDPSKDAVNIVAGGSVRNFNPVSCLTTAVPAAVTATTSGWCPDDTTGVTSTAVTSNGAFTTTSGPAQYLLMRAPGDRRIDAALFALQGSFSTDNADRAALVGNVTVNGGVYQEHRGVNGFLYSTNSYQRRTGYVLRYKYVDLRPAKLPYEPTTRSLSGRVWRLVSITGGGAS